MIQEAKKIKKTMDPERKRIDFQHLKEKENHRSWNAGTLPDFARLTDVNGRAPGPTFHAPDPRMT